MKRLVWLMVIILGAGVRGLAQTVSFNFSDASHPVSGWINAYGDPSSSVITASDPSSGISISSVATANWSPFGNCAYDGGGASGANPFFPTAVMANHWFNYSSYLAAYNALMPQLVISGLNVDSVYSFKMTGSFVVNVPNQFNLDPVRYTVAGATLYGYIDIDGDSNVTAGATFHNVAPDSTGSVRIYVNTYGGSNVASICGVQIISGRTAGTAPTVLLTNPANNAIIPEDGNVTLSATASESGGTISRVEFYAGSTLIGADSTAPYSLTWFSPNPGTYSITARAVDGTGNISTSSVNITVESLNYFWSTTGQIATGGDTSFLGTVDSNRLAFRTKNIERMSILPTGNIGIGTITPTAQFHTTGTVRLAGLTGDSTEPRLVVSDTSGNLYYRNFSSLGSSIGVDLGGGLGESSNGLITLGDSIPGLGPHSFTSNRYEYLNGNQFSFGGSVHAPVTQPVFRLYDNGDIAASTTMDTSVNTYEQPGLRYYSKLGILQIGATDRVDTTLSFAGLGGSGGGILMNSESANILKGRWFDSYIAGNDFDLDSTAILGTTMLNGGGTIFTNGTYGNDIISGFGHQFGASITNSIINGNGISISKPADVDIVTGFLNNAMDTARGSLIIGAIDNFGGLDQLVAGQYLTNRSPFGTVLGNANVDFSTLAFTGTQGVKVTNVSSYPVFAVGNSASSTGATHSNAFTVLYNGRTQINTTGLTNNLTQTQVTPQAALDVVSTNTGVLLPRLNTTQRNAIATGDLVNGLLLYNTDSSAFQYYNGSGWNSVGSGGSGSSGRWLFANGTVYDTLDNVAIGTSNTQGYKLAVNGAGIFTKIVAKPQASWPDYVFDKGYELLSLAELEQYIRAHHHLPGITPEAEVMQNGIDLGAQQTSLLKKVEELTLYLIHENQSLTSQNQQITDQTKVLSEQARQMAEQNKALSEQNKQLANQNARLEAQQKEIDELKALIKVDHKQ